MNHRIEKLNKIIKYEELRIMAENFAKGHKLIQNGSKNIFGDFSRQRAETYLAIADRLDKRITNLIKEL